MAYNRASEKDNAPEMIERVVYLNLSLIHI